MTRKFCDFCGETALATTNGAGLEIEKWCADGNSKILLKAVFEHRKTSLDSETSGDLCAKCRGELLHGLWEKYADKSSAGP